MKARVNLRVVFWCALVLFFGVRLWLAFKPHIIFWDEAVYLGMGKYLYSAGAAGLWEVLRPPLLPLMLGAVWKVTSAPLFYGELLSLLFSAGYVVATYFLGRELFGENVGVLSGLVVLLSPLFFLSSGFLLTDIPSAFFMLVSLFALVKKRMVLSGVLSGLAFLTRFPQGLVVLAVAAALLFPRWRIGLRHYGRYLTGFFAPIIPFFAFNYALYHDETNFFYALIRPIIFAAPHQANPFVTGGSFLFYAIELVKDNFLLVFVFVGVLVYIKDKMYARQPVNAVFFSLLTYLLYFSVIANKQSRFGIAFLGLAAIAAGFGIVWLFTALRKSWARALFVLLLVVLASFSVAQDNDYLGWRHDEEPAIVTEFYRYFAQNPVDGAILTADPVPVAYSDSLFIPYYFSAQSGLSILRDALARGDVGAIVYAPRSFPCLQGDSACVQQRDELVSLVSAHQLILNRTYNGEEYIIYRVAQNN